MAKRKVIREWVELCETFLEPKPADRNYGHEATMFVNHCKMVETPKGPLLIRSTGIETIVARNRGELSSKIRKLALCEDVRRLAKGVDSNDFSALPKEQLNPPQDVIDGTADVYMLEEEPASGRTE